MGVPAFAIAQAADNAREGLAAAAAALREDIQQKNLGTRQHVRHCLRGLAALGEAVRLAGRQPDYNAEQLCHAVNACLDLHSRSAATSAKAQLGRQPEAWTGVCQSLLDAARTVLSQLVLRITAQLGSMEDDIAQELASQAALHTAVPRACEQISQALTALAGLEEQGMHRVHLKLYNWLVDVYRNALAGFSQKLLPEALTLVREDGRRIRELFTDAGVLEAQDMSARYELLKSSARAASLIAKRKSCGSSSGAQKPRSGHPLTVMVHASSAGSLGTYVDLPSPSVFTEAAVKGCRSGSPRRADTPHGQELTAFAGSASVVEVVPGPRTPTARSWSLGGLLRASSCKGPSHTFAPIATAGSSPALATGS